MKLWVVSPNVSPGTPGSLSVWKQIMLRKHAAIMGWGLDHVIGRRFAKEVAHEDIILIARRHNGKPEMVGLGVVQGPAELGSAGGKTKRSVKGMKTPRHFGSLRKLSPFVHREKLRERIPLIEALGHTMALAKLHPNRRRAHKQVCRWMVHVLLNESKKRSGNIISGGVAAAQYVGEEVRIVNLPKNRDSGYEFRSKSTVVSARKKEAELLEAYRDWIQQKYGRVPGAIRVRQLTNDCFDEDRCNLLEAKGSIKREDIRMAVGQLFDYGFYAEKRFGKPNMAILLPRKPTKHSVEWLPPSIKLIWRKRGTFRDNANDKFI